MATRKQGFTLLELLVVMGIMVLLMSMAVAGYLGIRRGAELRGAVMTLRTTLMLARQEAVTKRRTVAVEFNRGATAGTADTITIISSSAGASVTNNVVHLPLGTKFSGTGAIPPVVFKPAGSAVGAGSQSISITERSGAVAGTTDLGVRTIKVWLLSGITEESE